VGHSLLWMPSSFLCGACLKTPQSSPNAPSLMEGSKLTEVTAGWNLEVLDGLKESVDNYDEESAFDFFQLNQFLLSMYRVFQNN